MTEIKVTHPLPAADQLHEDIGIPGWIAQRVLDLNPGESGTWERGAGEGDGWGTWSASCLPSGSLQISRTMRYHIVGEEPSPKMRDLRTQAFEQAALAVAEGAGWGETLEDDTRRFIRSADPHTIRGTNSEGAEISFTWSFSYDDVPAITARAREILTTDAR